MSKAAAQTGTYTGGRAAGNARHGEGKHEFADGGIFEGNWVASSLSRRCFAAVSRGSPSRAS